MTWRRDCPTWFAGPGREASFVASITLVPPGAERLAEDLLGLAERVHVRGVDQVDPRVEAHMRKLAGLGDLRRTDGL